MNTLGGFVVNKEKIFDSIDSSIRRCLQIDSYDWREFRYDSTNGVWEVGRFEQKARYIYHHEILYSLVVDEGKIFDSIDTSIRRWLQIVSYHWREFKFGSTNGYWEGTWREMED